jgi:calcium/proton exchanger cax
LGDATEQMSLKLGQTLSGLLNASFGNAVEIIVGVAALLQGVSMGVLYVVILAQVQFCQVKYGLSRHQ